MYSDRDMRNALLGAVVGVIVAYFLFGGNSPPKKEGGGCGCR